MGGREPNLNLDNVFKYTVFFFRLPLTCLLAHLLDALLCLLVSFLTPRLKAHYSPRVMVGVWGVVFDNKAYLNLAIFNKEIFFFNDNIKALW